MRAAYQFFGMLKLYFKLFPEAFIKRLDVVIARRQGDKPGLTFELFD